MENKIDRNTTIKFYLILGKGFSNALFIPIITYDGFTKEINNLPSLPLEMAGKLMENKNCTPIFLENNESLLITLPLEENKTQIVATTTKTIDGVQILAPFKLIDTPIDISSKGVNIYRYNDKNEMLLDLEAIFSGKMPSRSGVFPSDEHEFSKI